MGHKGVEQGLVNLFTSATGPRISEINLFKNQIQNPSAISLFKSVSESSHIRSVNIGDNYLDNNFCLWFRGFLKTCRLEFGINSLTEVNLTEMGLSVGLSDINEQLNENRLLQIADSLP